MTFSLTSLGGSISTTGGFVEVYPVPGPVIVMALTTPDEIADVAVALVVVPSPTGVAIVTIGADVYPKPPSVIVIDVIVPAADTLAVAAAETFEFCEINSIVCLFTSNGFSFSGSKKGLTL